jgi:hypothetical protein
MSQNQKPAPPALFLVKMDPRDRLPTVPFLLRFNSRFRSPRPDAEHDRAHSFSKWENKNMSTLVPNGKLLIINKDSDAAEGHLGTADEPGDLSN